MMNVRNRDHGSENSDSRVTELTAALDKAERKLAERELLISAAISQTEAARAQYEHAHARAETLRKQLDAKEEQVIALQQELRQRRESAAIPNATPDSKSAAKSTSKSDAPPEVSAARNDGALSALSDDAKQLNFANPSDYVAAMGLVMESLDAHSMHHKISTATTTIGRAPSNDVAIHSHRVSRFHARLIIESEGAFLIDLQSTNGCKVNGQRITRQMIGNGDVISIGGAQFKFTIGALAEDHEKAMGETHALLEDSVVFVPATKSKSRSMQ